MNSLRGIVNVFSVCDITIVENRVVDLGKFGNNNNNYNNDNQNI
jgi:hypothetical protein